MLESNPLKVTMLVGRLGVYRGSAFLYRWATHSWLTQGFCISGDRVRGLLRLVMTVTMSEELVLLWNLLTQEIISLEKCRGAWICECTQYASRLDGEPSHLVSHNILDCTMLCCTIPYYTIPYHTILYYTISRASPRGYHDSRQKKYTEITHKNNTNNIKWTNK